MSSCFFIWDHLFHTVYFLDHFFGDALEFQVGSECKIIYFSIVNLLLKCFGFIFQVVKVLFAQSYLTLCIPRDCSPPGSFAHGILQARILECDATPFSRGSKDLLGPGIEPGSPVLQADSSGPSDSPHQNSSEDSSLKMNKIQYLYPD